MILKKKTLPQQETRRFIDNALRGDMIKTIGTAIDKIMLPV